jgi:hypothetical protein
MWRCITLSGHEESVFLPQLCGGKVWSQMKNTTEGIAALIFAAVITFTDRLFISGPYLGLGGIALSIVAALIGWYSARLIGGRFLRQDYTVGGMGYSARPLMLFVAVSALIFAGLGFVKIFDMRKVDYTASDVFFHLLLVALAAFVIRMAGLALRAMKK